MIDSKFGRGKKSIVAAIPERARVWFASEPVLIRLTNPDLDVGKNLLLRLFPNVLRFSLPVDLRWSAWSFQPAREKKSIVAAFPECE
jgi:hypothetical protein